MHQYAAKIILWWWGMQIDVRLCVNVDPPSLGEDVRISRSEHSALNTKVTIPISKKAEPVSC